METTPAKPRELYAEVLRIIAAFSVVFQHTVTSAWYDIPVRTDEWLTLNFYNSIARFGVGVFIMISGAFMLSPRYAHPPEKILGKNLTRILLLLVFWVVIYGTVNTLVAGGSFKDIFATPLPADLSRTSSPRPSCCSPSRPPTCGFSTPSRGSTC